MEMTNNIPTFTTMNRKLEQKLYQNGIRFMKQHQNEDGMTVWTYQMTPRAMEILTEFRSKVKRPRMRLAYQAPGVE